MMMDADFEPQQRVRSNTWPLPRPDNFVEVKEEPRGAMLAQCGGPEGGLPLPLPAAAAAKKNSSRRNAWGNLSYADLITQAITSAPDKRLTLSQIYEWMVQNVPYFKDKGDSNSSAGWKNSIRHNLSLHNRFMRVQNEGTGKSSWWMINPDAKPGKSARRRATSMETSKFEKRRGRVKKKVEALRSGLPLDATPSPSSSVSESLDLFPESPLPGFQLSPDFRPRASSNASSCGRLSPIPAVPDWHTPAVFGAYGPEQLAGNLADGMKLEPAYYAPPPPPPPPYQPPPYLQQPPPQPPTPSTMMGQLMGALNNSTLLDDLNLNIETLQGGFDCDVDQVIKHELSMEGSLDFNFSHHHHHHHHHHHQGMQLPPEHQQHPQQGGAPYTTGPSWVH